MSMEAASELSDYLSQKYTEPGEWDATYVYSFKINSMQW
jgi:hypothetical protein